MTEQQQSLWDRHYWRDMKLELHRDAFQRAFRYGDERGEIRVNPKYLEAVYERSGICQGGLILEPLPYRFKGLKQVRDFEKNGHREVRKFAVPFFVLRKLDGTKEEVWE